MFGGSLRSRKAGRPAATVADHDRVVGCRDISVEVGEHRIEERAGRIGARLLAGEAGDLGQVEAVAPTQPLGGRAPRLARRGEAGMRTTPGPRPTISTEKRAGTTVVVSLNIAADGAAMTGAASDAAPRTTTTLANCKQGVRFRTALLYYLILRSGDVGVVNGSTLNCWPTLRTVGWRGTVETPVGGGKYFSSSAPAASARRARRRRGVGIRVCAGTAQAISTPFVGGKKTAAARWPGEVPKRPSHA